MKINNIRINGVREPVGFSMDHVTVSWNVVETKSQRAAGTSIRIAEESHPDVLLAERNGPDLSLSGEHFDIPLHPRTRYLVFINVSGDSGDRAEAVSFFETGKRTEPWQADWIAAESGDSCHPLMKKAFEVRRGLKSARLYAAGVGLFEAYINGEKLGQEYLKPGVTNYEKRIQVITFPVNELHEGENELSFLLGKGWYMGTFGLDNTDHNYGSRMAVIGELQLAYEDGSSEVICTDSSFCYRPSDIIESGIYYGETIDRTAAKDKWKAVSVLRDPKTDAATRNLVKEQLKDRLSLPILVKEILPVREILHTPAGETVLDFGQNFAGFPEFDSELPAGTKVVLDFGEVLQNGNFYRGNYREANSQLTYISATTGKQTHS